jgi:hypothetical protein
MGFIVQGGTSMNSRNLLGTLVCAIFVGAASSAAALDQNNPEADRLPPGNGEAAPPSPPETPPETMAEQPPCVGRCDLGCCPSCGGPRWTASAECIILDRVGSVNQTLVSTYPPHSPLVLGTGTERLNSNDLNQGVAAGPRVGLIRHGDGGYDVEFSFFQIDGWNSASSIAPNGTAGPIAPPPDWLVFTAPGGFVQTTDNTTQDMAWVYTTKLYNAELNVRWELCPRVTMLAGFRWVSLWEDLQGTISPSDRTAPFWDTKTRNNLYGLQIGQQWKMLNCGRFSLDGLLKAGLFDNDAAETTGVSIYRHVFPESASTDHAAFLGEIGLRCKYQVTQGLLLKVGYEAFCLQGVALAPAQIPQTNSHGTLPVTVQACGVDSGSGVFYHGATAGLEYSF